jgi:hypothetical protein
MRKAIKHATIKKKINTKECRKRRNPQAKKAVKTN